MRSWARRHPWTSSSARPRAYATGCFTEAIFRETCGAAPHDRRGLWTMTAITFPLAVIVPLFDPPRPPAFHHAQRVTPSLLTLHFRGRPAPQDIDEPTLRGRCMARPRAGLLRSIPRRDGRVGWTEGGLSVLQS